MVCQIKIKIKRKESGIMQNPISLSHIKAGWAVLGIGDSMYTISYLSDLKAELDYVLDLNNENNNKAVLLDMESVGTLCIQTLLDYDIIYITLFEMYGDRLRPVTYRYVYKEFLTYYIKVMEDNKNLYIDDFICPDDYDEEYKWNSEDYEDLRKKVVEE